MTNESSTSVYKFGFRNDDKECGDDPDVAPEPLRSQQFREKWECLSRSATEHLLKALNPRAVFDGHTHYGCKTWLFFVHC